MIQQQSFFQYRLCDHFSLGKGMTQTEADTGCSEPGKMSIGTVTF